MRWIIRLLINALALAAADWLLAGIHYDTLTTLVAMALIFGVVNALIRPVVKILSCPLLILTLGLFTFVINALMLLLASKLAQLVGFGFTVDSFATAFWGAAIVSLVSFVLSLLLPERREQD